MSADNPEPELFTVVQVIEMLGYYPENRDSWSLGNSIRALYLMQTGEEGTLTLRPKRDPNATVQAPHAHRGYPEDFLPDMKHMIHNHFEFKANQQDFFQ